jgi:hypothetical protein
MLSDMLRAGSRVMRAMPRRGNTALVVSAARPGSDVTGTAMAIARAVEIHRAENAACTYWGFTYSAYDLPRAGAVRM